jgi:hypothetical protein
VMEDSLVLTQGRTNHLVLDPLSIPHNDSSPTWPCPTTPYQDSCLDVFSHVVECIFLLQLDNVICQALLADSWGDSYNLCTIYTLLTVPLDTLTINFGRTPNAYPLSNAYKNQIIQFQDMYALCSSQPTWSDHNIFDLNSSILMATACHLHMIMNGCLPPVLPFHHCTHALASSSPSGFTLAFWWWGGRAERTRQFWTLFSGTTLHPWWHDRCIPWTLSVNFMKNKKKRRM